MVTLQLQQPPSFVCARNIIVRNQNRRNFDPYSKWSSRKADPRGSNLSEPNFTWPVRVLLDTSIRVKIWCSDLLQRTKNEHVINTVCSPIQRSKRFDSFSKESIASFSWKFGDRERLPSFQETLFVHETSIQSSHNFEIRRKKAKILKAPSA